MAKINESSIFRYWTRLLIGVALGLFIGTEVMFHTKTWIANPAAAVPLILLYIFIFSVLDDLIVRFNLNDRDLFIIGAVFGFIFGGISNAEMYVRDPQREFGIMGLNPVSIVLDTIAWGLPIILWFHTMNWVFPRKGRSSLMTWKGWVGNAVIFLFFFITFFNDRAIPERRLTDFILFLFAVFFALLQIYILRKRKGILQNVQNRNKLVTILGVFFVPVSIIVVVLGLEFIFPLPLHIFIYFLIYIPLLIYVLFTKRLAV